MEDGFTYKGFKYTYDLDIEPEENCKIMQECIFPDGTRQHMPWSPYSHPTEADFKLWIDLGCPENISGGNNNSADLERIRAVGMVTYMFDLKSRDSDWSRQNVRVTFGSERLALAYAANLWPSCDVSNFREDTRVAQLIELAEIEASIPKNYTRKEQEEIDRAKVDGI